MRLSPLYWTALTLLSLLLLGLAGDWVNPALLYRREALEADEYWRLLTGHVVHLGVVHTLLNLAGLALVLWLFAPAWPVRWWVLVFLSTAIMTSLCLYRFSPEIHYYAGLSGVLHGLLVFGLLPGLLRRDPLSLVMAVLVAAKLGYEQLIPDSHLGTEALIDAPVVGIAHLYGAIGGLLVGLVLLALKKFKSAV